jgi:hypothetical protein
VVPILEEEETHMVLRLHAVAVVAALLAGTAVAAEPKAYQVTGPVLEVRDDAIVVEKGKEKWEIARDPQTKVTGELKPGAKVTVKYTMKAKSVEVKGEAKKK